MVSHEQNTFQAFILLESLTSAQMNVNILALFNPFLRPHGATWTQKLVTPQQWILKYYWSFSHH